MNENKAKQNTAMKYINEIQSYNIPDGAIVEALYCGKQIVGEVVDSRVKYGARKQYSIKLHHELKFDWSGSNRKVGDIVLIENVDVVKVNL